MSVLLNEPALRLLLESEHGPVGRYTRQAAELVEAQARLNASGDILGIDTGDLLANLDFQMHHDEKGISATVGSDATHGIPSFSYPGFWDESGKPWLFSALQLLENLGWTVRRT